MISKDLEAELIQKLGYDVANPNRQVRRHGRHKLGVHMDDVMWEELNKHAKDKGCSVSELVRTFVEWGLENK